MTWKVAMATVGGLAALVIAACSNGKEVTHLTRQDTQQEILAPSAEPRNPYWELQLHLDNPVCSGKAKLDSSFQLYCVAPSDILNARSTLPIMDSNTLPPWSEGGGWSIDLRSMNYEQHPDYTVSFAGVYSNTYPAAYYGLQGMRPNEIFLNSSQKDLTAALGKHPLALIIDVYTGRDLPESTLEVETGHGKQKFYLPPMTAGVWELLPNQSGSTYLMAHGRLVLPGDAEPSSFTPLSEFTPLSKLVQNARLLRAAPAK